MKDRKSEITELIVLILMIIIAAFLLAISLMDSARADVYCEARKADDGETPVIIYVEGSTWKTDQNICSNDQYAGMNILMVCSRNQKYDLWRLWRQDDLDVAAAEIIEALHEWFPAATAAAIVTFSNGGCMTDPVFRQCQQNGIEALCVICMDAYDRRHGIKAIEDSGTPLLIMMSDTVMTGRGHVTTWTKDYAEEAGDRAEVRRYHLCHGRLETDKEPQNDMYEFIRRSMQ